MGYRGFVLTPAAGVPNDSGDSFYLEPQVVVASRAKSETEAEPLVQMPDPSGANRGGPLSATPPIVYAGVYNKYFAVLLHAADAESQPTLSGASWRAVQDEAWLARHPGKDGEAWRSLLLDLDLQLSLPPAGTSRTFRYAAYAGPKERDALVASLPDHRSLLEHDLGFVSGIARVLLWIMGAFHSLTQSWGFAIVLLTVLVRLILFPINRRSQTAMARYQAKMKRLQPRIEELKKKYANDSGKLRNEQTKLMQEEGAFPPLGGCLPMFLQIPVFIGLFAALRASFDLRQAPFYFWIQDLSLPDRLLPLGITVPFVGWSIPYLNVLPPLMVVLWVWQQKGMPTPADEQAARMQKMMLWMPVMMGFFLYNYAAGLSLYMITQSGLGIIEQKVIKKLWPLDETEQPRKKSSFLAKLMAAQEEQQKKRGKPKR